MKKYFSKLAVIISLFAATIPVNAKLYDNVWINDTRTKFVNNEAIILAINIRSFNSNDKNKNDLIEIEKGETVGTFLSAIERLDEIKAQGINTLHLLPVTPTGKIKAIGTAGSLYAISDFTKLDPQLDDTSNKLSVYDEAKLFIKECHKRGLSVIFDLPSCGSYDMYLTNPSIFLKNAEGQPIIPADWTDVRLFNTLNSDGTLNEEVFELHKKYVDLVQKLGADGIRADVATLKTYEFWNKLISYAREKDNEFLFLAEASEAWSEPVAKEAIFTPYYKLLDAGFDGWYGSFFEFKNWQNADKLSKELSLIQDIRKEYQQKGKKKAAIGSFATHDEQSTIVTGGTPFSEMVIWLQATLPINSYFVDGIQTGDSYQYKYANKKAEKTYTDDDYYYVHNGKFDIFNYSRKPGSKNKNLEYNFTLANKFKTAYLKLITHGVLEFLNTKNEQVYAYTYTLKNTKLLVVLNRNLSEENTVKIKLKDFENNNFVTPIKVSEQAKFKKNILTANLAAGEIIVFIIQQQN